MFQSGPAGQKPKKNAAPMLSNQTGFPVERACTVDANKLVREITVSGPPREGSLDAPPAPPALTPPFRHPRARPGDPAMSLRPRARHPAWVFPR